MIKVVEENEKFIAIQGNNAIKLTKYFQTGIMWKESYREGTYMGEIRFPGILGRG